MEYEGTALSALVQYGYQGWECFFGGNQEDERNSMLFLEDSLVQENGFLWKGMVMICRRKQ